MCLFVRVLLLFMVVVVVVGISRHKQQAQVRPPGASGGRGARESSVAPLKPAPAKRTCLRVRLSTVRTVRLHPRDAPSPQRDSLTPYTVSCVLRVPPRCDPTSCC